MKLGTIALASSLFFGAFGVGGCSELEYQRTLMARRGVELDSSSRPGTHYNSANVSRPSSSIYWRIEHTFPRAPTRRNRSSWEWESYERDKRDYERKLRSVQRSRQTHSVDAHGNILLPYGQGRPSRISPPQRPVPQRRPEYRYGSHRR